MFYDTAVRNRDNKYYWLIDEKLPIAILNLQIELEKQGYNSSGFKITYGHRSPSKNELVNGARLSKHIVGQAVDIVIEDIDQDGVYTENDKNIVLEIAEKIDDKYGMRNAIYHMGIIYAKKKDFSNAIDYLSKSLEIAKEIKDKQGIVDNYIYIGDVLNLQRKYKEAIENCEIGLKLAKIIKTLDLESNSCSCLYKAYKAIGNGNKALEYHEQMLVLNDSLKSEETAKKLQQMEIIEKLA